MASLRLKILTALTIILLTLSIGLFTGIKNTSDYDVTEYTFSGLDGDVKVYRNERGIPTIIAESESDLFFAQGYEFARDRLFQAEFFRSLTNGELSRLFGGGESLLIADKYFKVLSLQDAAEKTLEKLDQEYIDTTQRYLDGLNAYISDHKNNLPLEFVALGVEPKPWTLVDSLAIQGLLARDLSISGLNRELFRQDLTVAFGSEDAVQLIPIFYKTALDYYRAFNTSGLTVRPTNVPINNPFLNLDDDGITKGSNSWVVGASKSDTGNPLFANDPHLGLSTPGIWWQVHLVTSTYHVEGYALPGAPGIIIGHNEHVIWGMTNTGTDAVDIFYFNTRNEDTEYFDGETNSWLEFFLDNKTIELPNGESEIYTVKRTKYGPVLDPDIFGVPEDGTHVMRWTLLEDHPEDMIFKAIQDLNRAETAQDIHDALRYFSVPSQNIVYATIDGDYGYHYTGLTPIRKIPGSGVLPQNGSDSSFGWSGFVDYEDFLWEQNPDKGFWSTANEEIDYREETNFTDSFYITDLYAPPYRGDRVKFHLENNATLTVEDMKTIQGDTHDLYAELIIGEVADEIRAIQFEQGLAENIIGEARDARNELLNWNFHMDRNSIGATIFAAFRIYFEEFTFRDEFDRVNEEFYDRYDGFAEFGMVNIISNETSKWFDDQTTPDDVEQRADIVERAFDRTVEYLDEILSGRVAAWQYEDLHQVTFEHPMGEALGILNAGPTPSDGSEHTLKAAGGTPRWSPEGPLFDQTNGPSMRLVADVESVWSQVYGIVVPGESGHFLSGHRDDSLGDWVNNITHRWDFRSKRDEVPDFTFRKE